MITDTELLAVIDGFASLIKATFDSMQAIHITSSISIFDIFCGGLFVALTLDGYRELTAPKGG
jgi:hypothetical protein